MFIIIFPAGIFIFAMLALVTPWLTFLVVAIWALYRMSRFANQVGRDEQERKRIP